MRRYLLSGTAIVAAGTLAMMAPQAHAQDDSGPIQLGVGGYHFFYYTISDQDIGDHRADRVRQEGEIHFSGETTLDNGIQVGAQVELESEQSGDQIDEHYMWIEGSFGRVEVGAHNSAPYLMHTVAPNVGMYLNSPNFIPFSTAATGIFPTTYAVQSSDANKLTYFSPRMAGFQIGASYAPDTANTSGSTNGTGLILDDNDPNATGNQGRAFGVGVNFSRSFNSFDVSLSGGYELVEDDNTLATGGGAGDNDDNEQFTFGGTVGYAGFAVGGSYRHEDDDPGESYAYDAGVSYSVGPWGTSLNWIHQENASDDTLDHVKGSLTYALGAGVTTNFNLHYLAQDVDGGGDNDGIGASAGMRLSF